MKLEDLIRQKEGKTIEFKANILPKDKIISTVIAFSNTAGGKLIIGVTDGNRNIVGIDNPILVEESLASLISDSIVPQITPNIEILAYRNTYVIIIEVYPGSNKPYYHKSKNVENSTYIRIGSTNRLANAEIIKNLQRSLLSKTFDEEIMNNCNSEDVDFRVTSELFSQVRTLKDSDYYSLGLLAKDGNHICPSVGAILLFGKAREKYFPDCWLQMGCFDGTDRSNISDNLEIKECLPFSIEIGMKFLQKHLMKGLKIEGIQNKDNWLIPEIALREALINSVVHADYSITGSPIRVSIFSDRVEFENPGLLASGLTLDDIFSGISKIRNRIIARVFKELRLVESWGSGIQRIINNCKNAGLHPPIFEEIGYRFRVTFFKVKFKLAAINETEAKIIKALEEHGSMSTNQIAKLINLSTKSTRANLVKMINKDRVFEIAQSLKDPNKKYDLK